jgi:dienelactone hydrolase
VASIGYRLSNEAIFPVQIHDVKAAIRYLRANATTYRLDPDRVALFGSSAGGHLASLAGFSEGDLEDLSMGNPAVSSRVQAVVDWYGPVRFDEMDSQLAAQGCATGGHGGGSSPESRLLGCTVSNSECDQAVQTADPSRYAGWNDPATFILHGAEDCVVPGAQSALLEDALRSAGACTIRRIVSGAAHGGIEWSSAPVQDSVEQFLDAALSAVGAGTPPEIDCSAFTLSGDSTATNGAQWTYVATHQGVGYDLQGVLFSPSGSGPFPAVVLSHGFGGSPDNYSSATARTMVGWGMVAIGPMYTHAAPPLDDGNLPAGDPGASSANVLRAHKARDLLSCIASVDLRRVAAHGHSMGAFVTGELIGTYPHDFRAASHTAGGVSPGPNATRETTARQIRIPYQLHHGDQDTTVAISQDRALDQILTEIGAVHELIVYPGYSHSAIAHDATMLERVREWYRAHGVLPQ